MNFNKKLSIYLADLTHTHIALATGTFPLGLAYVASAIKKVFHKDVELNLFKYPEELSEKINDQYPDIFMFSNYMWSQNLNLLFAKKIKELSPATLIVCGGPNMSKDKLEREKFLKDHPYIDFILLQEGEIAACHLIKSYEGLGRNLNKLKEADVLSAITLLPDNLVKEWPLAPRLGVKNFKKSDTCHLVPELIDLEDVPSPYLTGLMDKFFDNRLYPLIETNRGCPFSCTFCQQGEGYFNQVAKRPLDMVKEELEFIGDKMRKHSPGIFRIEIADPNFAMFKQDMDICEYIRTLQDKYSWPRYIGCSTGKNKPDQILEAVSKLYPDSLVVSNSMQSINRDTLKAVKRSNISFDTYDKVQTEIHKRGLRSMADLILGLPLEKKASHFEAIFNLIDSGVQEFTSYQSMILKSTDLELDSSKKKYGLNTKWRLLPRGIGRYSIGEESMIVSEAEQIVVSTNTLTFEEYLEARQLHLINMIYHNSGLFELIYSYLKEYQVKSSQLIRQIYTNSTLSNFPLKEFFDEFLSETQEELFESEKDCLNFYSEPKNMGLVEKSEIGGNLLFHYLSVAMFEKWDSVIEIILKALEELVPAQADDLKDMSKILKARVVDIIQVPMKRTIPVQLTSVQVIELIKRRGCELEVSSSGTVLAQMELNKNKYDMLSHAMTVYPKNRTGRSLILSVNRVHNVMRDIAVGNY